MAVTGGYGQAQQFNDMSRAAEQATFHVGRLVGQIALMQATTGTIGMAVSAFANLERSLVMTNSVAEGTARQLREMENVVRNFALATKFSATEGANALYFLASAGMSIQQSMSAMNGVLLLSQATLTDVATTADTVAGTLSAFQMEANQASRVANLFAASIAVSQASMDKLAFSMRQVAPVAQAMGVNVEETTAALSVLYNVGLRGEQAGTALRNSMVRILNPTANAKEALSAMGVATIDLTGKARNLKDVLEDLAKANPTLATLKTIVEDEALPGAQALIAASDPARFRARLTPGTDLFDKGFADRAQDIANRAGVSLSSIRNELDLMEVSISNTQAASRMAMEQITTLSGSFALAKNGLTEFATTFGQSVAPALNSIAQLVTDAAIAWRSMDRETQKMITQLPLIAAGVWGVSKALGTIPAAMVAASKIGSLSDMLGITKLGHSVADLQEARGVLERRNPSEYARRNSLTGIASDGNPYALTGAPAGSMSRYVFAAGPDMGRAFGGTAQAGQRMRWDAGTGSYVPNREGAPTKFGSFMAGATGVLGTLLTVASIAAIVATVAPMVYEWLKGKDTPDAKTPTVDLAANAKRQLQSIQLSTTDPFEQYKQINEMRDNLFSQVGDYQKLYSFSTERFNELRGGLSGNLQQLFGGNLGQNQMDRLLGSNFDGLLKTFDDYANGGATVGQISGQIGFLAGATPQQQQAILERLRANPELIKALQTSATEMRQVEQEAKVAEKNALSGNQAIIDATNAMSMIEQLPGYQDAAASEGLKKSRERIEEATKFQFVSNQMLNEFSRAARAQENAVARMRGELESDSFSKFVIESFDIRANAAREALTEAERKKEAFTRQFGNRFAGMLDFENMIMGLDYRAGTIMQDAKGAQYVVPKTGEDGKAVIKKGIATMLEEGGFSKEQMLQALDEAVKEAMGWAATLDPTTRQYVEKSVDAQKRYYASVIEQMQIQQMKAFEAAKSDALNKREFVYSLRKQLVDFQVSLLRSSVEGMGDAGTAMQARLDLTELTMRGDEAGRVLRQLRKQYFDEFAKYGDNEQATAEWKKFETAYLDANKKIFQQGIDNIIRTMDNARARALSNLRVSASQSKADYAEIAKQLYIMGGGDRSMLNDAINAEGLRSVAEIDGQIANAEEKVRSLRTNLFKLAQGQGLKFADVPDLQVPQQTLSFYNDSLTVQREIRDAVRQMGSSPGLGTGEAAAANGPYKVTAGGTGGGSWVDATIWRESRGNPFAKNPNSSATGLGQFIDSTWLSLIRQFKEQLTNEGFSIADDPHDQLKQRTNASLSRRMIELYGQQNAAYLGSQGFGTGDTEMYLAHFLGGGGAAKFLRGYERNPDGLARDSVTPGAYAANKGVFAPGGKDLTNAQVYAQVQRDMAQGAALLNQALGGVNVAVQTSATNMQQAGAAAQVTKDQWNEWIGGIPQGVVNIDSLTSSMERHGATQEQIAAVKQVFADKSLAEQQAMLGEIETLQKVTAAYEQLRASKQAQISDPGYRANQEHAIELQKLEGDMARMTRVGSFMDGITMKARHMRMTMQTDFELGASAFEQFATGAADILAGLITGTVTDWKKALAQLLASIAQAILKALFLRAITSMFGGAFGSSDGNVFGGGVLESRKGNVIPHSVGGMVNSNQYFPLSNGGMVGSISETGNPEAIMPLARGPGGKLGVMLHSGGYAAQGGMPTTPINRSGRGGGGGGDFNYQAQFNFYGGAGEGEGGAQADEREASAFKRDLDRSVEEAVVKVAQRHSRPGGMFHDRTRKYGQGVS